MLLRGRRVLCGVRRQFKTMSSSELRRSFIKFFVDRGHTYVPSSSIAPLDDPSVLFVTAGMNQFKSLILGTCGEDDERSVLKRAVNSQKCLRAGGKHNDLDDVGTDLTHHTFFEMLGNWSFGDYFKEEACHFAWEYLTDVLNLPTDRLYISYFGGDQRLGLERDDECRDIWHRIGVNPSRVVCFDGRHNLWEMGESGPCGPSCEVHFDMRGDRDAAALVNSGDPSVVEIWNLVFMQYNREESGRISQLPLRHIDCGMGLERAASIMQHVGSSYDSDLFAPLINHISQYARCGGYGGCVGVGSGRDAAYRTVADHLRALCIAISDGVLPDNTGRGYVLRRMLRRAARMSSVALQADRGLLTAITPFFASFMAQSFPEVRGKEGMIKGVISSEESQFWKVVDRGERMFTEEAEKSSRQHHPFSGAVAWNLHNTYGFPIELTSMLADERQLPVDIDTFNTLREQSKDARQMKGNGSCWRNANTGNLLESRRVEWTNDMAKYEHTRMPDGSYVFNDQQARVVALFTEDGSSTDRLECNTEGCLLLDQTIYFAEQGGQIADNGILCSYDNDEVFSVSDVQRRDGFVFIIGHTNQKSLSVDTEVTQRIDGMRRQGVMRAHTGTHLLLDALRGVLGGSVFQKGSLVLPDRIRFDCNIQQPLSTQQLVEVEMAVNGMISSGRSVKTQSMEPSSLRAVRNIQSNITATIKEVTWSGQVRVVSVEGEPPTAVECCCGTHVDNTSDVESLVIISDKSMGSNVRRITALTGGAARSAVMEGDRLKDMLKDSQHSTLIPKELKRKSVPLRVRRELSAELKRMKKDGRRDIR